MNRRRFSASLVAALGTYALMGAALTRRAFTGPVQHETAGWLRQLHEMCQDLETDTLTPGQWQERIEALYRQVSLVDLVRAIDVTRLRRDMVFPDLGVATMAVKFPRLGGLPDRLAFHGKLFGMSRDRAIIPHGHRNMASCHYVLEGELHLRHYDKIADHRHHMLIEPTVDRHVGPGTHSSISDERNNVHWLTARTERAFTFDVIVLDLGGARWQVDNIDPRAAEPAGDGRLRAPKLDVGAALRKYGHESHH